MKRRLDRALLFRRRLVLGLLALAAVSVLMRAVYLQIVHKDFLQAQGNARYLREVEVPAHRGPIVDRHGVALAVSSPVDSVWANPGEILKHRERLPLLAQVLELEPAALTAKLIVRAEREFVYLRRHLTPSRAQQALALGLPGLYAQREYRRFYPTAEICAHLLGFTDIDDNGQDGLELAYNDWLQSEPGHNLVLKDRHGRVVEDVARLRPPQPGRTLTLSIDRRLQYLAYRALKAGVRKHRAEGASAVLLDVASGEVLAMVNQPAANPNDRQALHSKFMRNRAVTDVFEPGSTLKPLTIAMALESGQYSPSTPIDTSPGHIKIGRKRVRDVRNYGRIDVARVISKSSNVGTSKIALSLPPERLWKLYRRLGFGQATGLGLTGEQGGVLRHYSDWSEIGHANHAFGYGLAVTALQLAQAYSVLAADGIRRPLTILHRDEPPAGERILQATTARQLRQMMEAVVSRKGTGYRARVAGYRVAGKTGTVRKIENGRYSRQHYRALFAGMAPASRPRLVLVVMVDDPQKDGYYGGLVAAPIFSQIMTGALRLLNVAPDNLPPTTLVVAGASENAQP